MVFWGEKNMIRLSLRITTTVAIASLCGAGFLSCKNGAAGRSMETGVNPSDVTEISSASDVVIPGDGKITIDAYRKDKDEDDFKLAVSSTAITGPNLALASTPLKLAETYKCTVTIRKVDRVSFQMVDVLTSAATACEPLPAPAAGFNFKISGIEADSLYVAILHVVPDSTPNSATTVKAVLPPISDECRGDQARFTMMADALTNGAANLILELVKIADTTSSAPNADAQTTLLHLNLPDLLHFAAGSKREMDDAASDYASIFSDIYTDVIMSSSSFDVAVCESTTGILLKPGSIAENLTIYTQSTAIQAWNAMIGLADAVSQTIDQIYTISIEIPDNVDFPFLRSVHKAYLTVAHNATAANVVDEYEAIDKTETGFNLETSPAPSLAPNY